MAQPHDASMDSVTVRRFRRICPAAWLPDRRWQGWIGWGQDSTNFINVQRALIDDVTRIAATARLRPIRRGVSPRDRSSRPGERNGVAGLCPAGPVSTASSRWGEDDSRWFLRRTSRARHCRQSALRPVRRRVGEPERPGTSGRLRRLLGNSRIRFIGCLRFGVEAPFEITIRPRSGQASSAVDGSRANVKLFEVRTQVWIASAFASQFPCGAARCRAYPGDSRSRREAASWIASDYIWLQR